MADFYDIILKFELALPFLLLSLYLSIVVLGRKKQDKKSLQKLISLYKEKEDGRKKTVIEFLKNKVGLDEPASEETSKKILEARKSFVQKLISAFLTRKEESISNLDNELSLITRSYQELSISVSKEEVTEDAEDEPETSSAIEAPAKADPTEAEDLARLKKENKNLKIEVHTTLSTLNNIFVEYTSMFGEESERKDMSVDEILTAMESFGADQVEAATSTDASAEDLMKEPQAESEPKEEAEPEAKVAEPAAEEEPSWDEAFEEAEAEPEVKEESATEDVPKENDDSSDDGWGDDNDDINELDGEDTDEIQPEWGNAMEEELENPDEEEQK